MTELERQAKIKKLRSMTPTHSILNEIEKLTKQNKYETHKKVYRIMP